MRVVALKQMQKRNETACRSRDKTKNSRSKFQDKKENDENEDRSEDLSFCRNTRASVFAAGNGARAGRRFARYLRAFQHRNDSGDAAGASGEQYREASRFSGTLRAAL